MKKATLPKIIVILGPTSSGKSAVAIKLAQKFHGEILSADSRQVYRYMNIGTGKVPKSKCKNKNSKLQLKNKKLTPYCSNGIKHYLIDLVSPSTNYNVAKFKKDADLIISDILQRGKLPIICGGTGFWIKAVIDNVLFPEVKPNQVLRNRLRNKTTEQLFALLKKLDWQRAKNIDAKNPVRLIRAIEICKTLGSVPTKKTSPKYNVLQIGIDLPLKKLHQNIEKRLQKRWRIGMINEVKNLHEKQKLSWKKIQSFGLGYFWIPLFIQGKISKKELFEKVFLAEKDYAKRQLTWFKKDKRIKWLKKYSNIEQKIKKFLEN